MKHTRDAGKKHPSGTQSDTLLDVPFDQARVQALLQENAELKSTQEKLNRHQAELKETVQSLQQQLDWFKRQLFGQTSEKKDFTDSPYQTTIADLLSDLPDLRSSPEKEEKTTVTYQRGKAKTNKLDGSPDGAQLRFDESAVPVEEIVITPPELDGEDKDDYDIIGEKVTYRLAQNPASYVVLKYVTQTVKRKATQEIISSSASNSVFEKSLADVSFLAGLLIEKFIYHQPLYRQHQRLENNHIRLARSTLTLLVQRVTPLLKPIYDSQLDHILLSRILSIDETPIKVGKKSRKNSGKKSKPGKLEQAYLWPIMGEEQEICFTYSSSRGMNHLTSQLGEFSGTILSDGYKAYDLYAASVDSAKIARCWVHCRRYFEKCGPYEPEASQTALAYIGRLYKIESQISKEQLKGDKKLARRLEDSKPTADAFFNWVYEQSCQPDLLPSSNLAKALKYAQNQEYGLREFLNNPDLPLDTNHVERPIRNIAMGRRNWLFCWTELGAEHVGIIQSLLSTCRLHNVNPYDYLVDVLQRVSEHPASRIEELTPRRWKDLFADNPMRSDLYKRNHGMI